jgi:hypothetical protein
MDAEDDEAVSVAAGWLALTPSTVMGMINSRGDFRIGSLADSRTGSRRNFLLSKLTDSAVAIAGPGFCIDSCRLAELENKQKEKDQMSTNETK